MAICPEAKRLVMESEGFRGRQYLCPAGKPTIGYGHRIRRGEVFDPDKGITRDEAEALLDADLRRVEMFLDHAVTAPLTECQRGALVSFAYNVGATALERSTLLRLLNAGDYQGAAGQFERWVYVTINGNKIVKPGLVKRRVRERELFSLGLCAGEGA